MTIQWVGNWLCVCAMFAGAVSPTHAADEVDLLKREIELLKKENDLLKKEVEQLKSQLKSKTPAKPDDEIVGAIWEITFVNDAGKTLGTTRFLASEGKLYTSKKQIGTYTDKGTQVRLDVTSSNDERGNGVYILVPFNKNPVTYRGAMKNTKGGEAKVTLRVIQD